MNEAEELAVFPLRTVFRAKETLELVEGEAANLMRGAFGSALRRVACKDAEKCAAAGECAQRQDCEYAKLFEPIAGGYGPSGLGDPPRPFVLRAHHLEGGVIEQGTEFAFGLNLFGEEPSRVGILERSFREMARWGLGRGKKAIEFCALEQLDGEGQRMCAAAERNAPLRIRLDGEAKEMSGARLRFRTPTELKAGGRIVTRPEFATVAARLRDRIAMLCRLYGSGTPAIDFREWGVRARQIAMTRCEVREVFAERRSSRTGRQHGLGGFIGEADYHGEIGWFLAYLKAARWTGVGRQTVWGKGEMLVETLEK